MDDGESAGVATERPTERNDARSRPTIRAVPRELAHTKAGPRESSMPRILVVDDEVDKRLTLAVALRSAGFDAHAVSSAEATLEAAGSTFDVAIVDLMLHGTNGFELARRLKNASPAVRVVLTSEYHFSATQLARIDCGAIGFVPRPFALAELIAFLQSKLSFPPPAA